MVINFPVVFSACPAYLVEKYTFSVQKNTKTFFLSKNLLTNNNFLAIFVHKRKLLL